MPSEMAMKAVRGICRVLWAPQVEAEYNAARERLAEVIDAEFAPLRELTGELAAALDAWERFAAHCEERRISVPLWAAELSADAARKTSPALARARELGIPAEANERVEARHPDTALCPFCNEGDFDLIGLKHHLERGWCESFNSVADSYARKQEKDA